MQPLGHDHLEVEKNDDSHILSSSKVYQLLKTLVLLGKRSAVDERGQRSYLMKAMTALMTILKTMAVRMIRMVMIMKKDDDIEE